MHDGKFLEITYRKSLKSIDCLIKHMKYLSHLIGLAFKNYKIKIEIFWNLFKRFVEIKKD